MTGRATAYGDLSVTITGIAHPEDAEVNELAIAYNRKYAKSVQSGKARVALLGKDMNWQDLGLAAGIYANRPRHFLALISHYFVNTELSYNGINENTKISRTAVLGPGCSVGPYTVIGNHTFVGTCSHISSQVTIGDNCRIGRFATIYPGVRIGDNIEIGDYFIAHPNVVIGSDGYSYETAEKGAIEEVKQSLGRKSSHKQAEYTKIQSLGTVVIGNNVEIGAGCAIDRGTFSSTSIGSGTKLDNLVHIAHNVSIGENCLLCGQVGIAGSVKVGDRVVLAGKSGIKDHIHVGNDVIAAGASQIFRNVSDGQRVMGDPAMDMRSYIASYKVIRRLPELFERVKVLEKFLEECRQTDEES